jgi:hypothetical protein
MERGKEENRIKRESEKGKIVDEGSIVALLEGDYES